MGGNPAQEHIDQGSHWQDIALCRPLIEPFFEDDSIHLDNNAIENEIRPLALWRKNFLFVSSHDGAKRIAMMYFFCAFCKDADLLSLRMTNNQKRIINHPIYKLYELLPSNFQKL